MGHLHKRYDLRLGEWATAIRFLVVPFVEGAPLQRTEPRPLTFQALTDFPSPKVKARRVAWVAPEGD